MHEATKRLIAQATRKVDLLNLSNEEIRHRCFLFGRSRDGTREEIIERLYDEVWKVKYDE